MPDKTQAGASKPLSTTWKPSQSDTPMNRMASLMNFTGSEAQIEPGLPV